jgi:hypothetical protein
VLPPLTLAFPRHHLCLGSAVTANKPFPRHYQHPVGSYTKFTSFPQRNFARAVLPPLTLALPRHHICPGSAVTANNPFPRHYQHQIILLTESRLFRSETRSGGAATAHQIFPRHVRVMIHVSHHFLTEFFRSKLELTIFNLKLHF